jgi:diaminopimelate epimerase
MVKIQFHKYQALGNDYIVVDADEHDAIPPQTVPFLCYRFIMIPRDHHNHIDSC